MCTLESMEIEILKHLYEKGLLDINEGWEKQSELDQSCAGAPRCKQRGMFAPPLQTP